MLSLRDFGKKVLFRGWVKPRQRIGLFRNAKNGEMVRHLKRYYRMTARRVLGVIFLVGSGFVLGNEEFIVGIGCFVGIWLTRGITKGLFNTNMMSENIGKLLEVGIISIERCGVSVLRCIFDVLKVREKSVVENDIEKEILIVRYIV